MPDLAPFDFYLFANLKKMLAQKIFGSNVEVNDDSEAYLRPKMLENWDNCIDFKGHSVDE